MMEKQMERGNAILISNKDLYPPYMSRSDCDGSQQEETWWVRLNCRYAGRHWPTQGHEMPQRTSELTLYQEDKRLASYSADRLIFRFEISFKRERPNININNVKTSDVFWTFECQIYILAAAAKSWTNRKGKSRYDS